MAYNFGDGIGQMAEEMNVSGWYAPAMNTHRAAFGGRNFNYFNADQIIRAGGSAQLATYDVGSNYVTDTTSATSIKAMRNGSYFFKPLTIQIL